MEAAPLFLLLLLPPADTTGDMANGIQTSLRRELGDVAMAVAPSTLVTPAMWQGDQAQLRARFVARVEWTTEHIAKIELLSAAAGSAANQPIRARELAFAAQDGKSERGRAIGLVLAELLRELPGSAFTEPLPAVAASKVAVAEANHLALGAMLAVARARSGNWATGPILTYGFGLGPAWSLQASGFAFLGSADGYLDLGFGLGARWDFLRSAKGRLGIGLGAELFRESAGSNSDDGHAVAQWSPGLVGTLVGRVTLWRSLRLVAAVDMRAVMRSLDLTVGDDEDRQTHGFSHWRPGLTLGLELAL